MSLVRLVAEVCFYSFPGQASQWAACVVRVRLLARSRAVSVAVCYFKWGMIFPINISIGS